MSYISNARIFCKFEALPLLEQISGGFLSVQGVSPVLVPGVFGQGLQLSTAEALTCTASTGITNALTVSFWLNPSNPGLAITPSSTITAMKQSLMSVSNFPYNSGTGVTSLSAATFVVWEETQDYGLNVMKIRLVGSSTNVIAASAPYTAGAWHHFWIVYSGSLSVAKIYVDGVNSTTLTGTLPSSLVSPTYPFQINQSVDGHAYEVFRNLGQLDELFLLNVCLDDIASIARVADLGAEYAIDTPDVVTQEAYFGAITNDPGTIQATGIASTTSEVFVGRSDGTLLRGSRNIWQLNRSFSGTSEADLLQQQYGAGVEFSGGVLTPSVAIRS
jgi:hypothetical protein